MDTHVKIDAYLQDNLDQFIEELRKFCAQPSISATGEGLPQMANLVQQALEARDVEVTQVPTAGGPVVFGRLAGKSERTLLFYNHYDVQPPDPLDQWISPPFEPTLREGALYARGAKDDKGELAARLAALDAVLAAHDGELPCSVLFVVEGGEEIGSPHIQQFVQDHLDWLQCDAAIWEGGFINQGGHPGTVLGCRGVQGLELYVRTMKQDAHSGLFGHSVPSAAWRLVHALASLKDENGHILIADFYDDTEPISDLDRELLRQLPETEAFNLELLGLEGYMGGLTGQALREAVFQPTCNIQGITTGYQGPGTKTVLPCEATAKLDFRLAPGQTPTGTLEKLRAHLDAQGFADVEIRPTGSMLPYKVAADDPFIQLTNQTAEETYGKTPLNNPLLGGSSPMYAVGLPLGIPIVWAGVGYWDNKIHGPNEHVRLVDFLNGARHIARIIDGFADL